MKSVAINKKANKKKPVKNLRNVLAQPCDIYRTSLKESDHELLFEKLILFLKRIKVLRQERKKLRQNNKTEDNKLPEEHILKSIKLGANEVIRSVETSRPVCVLLSDNTSTVMFTNHIYALASSKEIPVLVLNNLNNIVKKNVGIEALAIAFFNNEIDDSFKELCDKFVNLYKDLNVPAKNTCDKSIIRVDKTLQKPAINVLSEKKIDKPKEIIHLTKVSNTNRVFIPPSYVENIKSKSHLEFQDNQTKTIKLTDNSRSSSKQNNIRYIPLKIKKIKGNENRRKKK